jgi:two-component system OmpR family sensor kinase
VLVVVLVVTASVALAVDGITYVSLRSFLLQRVDEQLDAAHRPIVRAIVAGRGVSADDLAALAPGLYIERRDEDGDITDRAALRRPDQDPVSPAIPALDVPEELATARSTDDVTYRTVPGPDDDSRYRVGTWRLPTEVPTLVLALPLDEVDSTLKRLLFVELVVTLGVLAAGVALARTLVKLGLRPLDDIATTASAIAAGDLTRRVSRQEPTTEVGRLGSALNAMLGQIEGAFAERRTSEDQLRRFVADASHELRTPLTSIRAYAELFERGADQRPEDLARLLRGIESEAARMGILVDDLLLLARLDQGRALERRPVDLGAVADDAIDAARAVDPDRPLRLVVDGSVEVAGDQSRLRQIVDNLLANVRAHTPPGTAATVRVSAEGTLGVLVVEDEGPGLPDGVVDRAFERFYRGDPSRSRDAGGSGLGLAIVAAIAAAHGGRATAGRAAGGGAAFRVELPLLPHESPPVADS